VDTWNKNTRENVKMFDIISEEILKERNIEEILLTFNYTTIYIYKRIQKKEDLNFDLPKLKNIVLKKAFVLEDLNLVKSIKEKDAIVLVNGGDIKSNTSAISNKSEVTLLNPIGTELCFDEGLAEIAKQNKKIIYFNINEIRTNQYRAIKQMNFIIPLLRSKNIEMRFVTLSRKSKDLIDEKILENFLKNFNLEKETINRFLNAEK